MSEIVAQAGQEPSVAHPTHRTSYVRWHIVGLLFLASFVAYVLRTNMSVAGESMMTDLGISKIQFGFVLAAFAWGYAMFQFPGGVLGDIIGSRRALTYIMVMWGVLTVGIGLLPAAGLLPVTNMLMLVAGLRFLMGAAQAPLYPVTGGGTISNWFPVSGWAFPNGLTSTGLTLGAAATGPLIAWMVIEMGWRQSFLLTAPLAFFVAGIWWNYSRDYPVQHSAVSQSELNLIDADRPPPEVAQKEKGIWLKVLMNRDILLLTLSYFCMNYVFYIFFNWFFIYLVDVRGFDVLEGGLLAAAPWLVGAVGATIGGIGCDRLSKTRGARLGYRIIPVISLSLVALLLFAGATANNAYLAVFLLSLCFGCTQLTEGSYWAAAISVSGRHAAAATGVLNTGGNVVGGIGALLVPYMADKLGWVVALTTGSVFAITGAVLWLFIRADRPMIDQ